MLDKLINRDIEMTVLSSILSGKNTFEEEDLKEDYFYYIENQRVFEAMQSLSNNKENIDLISLKQKLLDMELRCDSTYILNLMDFCYQNPTPFKKACNTLEQLFKKRKLYDIPQYINEELSSNKSYEDIYESITAKMSSSDIKDSGVITLGDEIESTLMEINDKADKKIEKFDIGFPILQKYMAIRKGNFITIGGSTGCGKTTVILNIALNVSKTKRVLFVSLEMTKEEMKYKILSALSGIEYWKIEHGKLSDDESIKLGTAINEWANGNLMLYENSSKHTTISNIRAKCKHAIANGGLDLIVIDYMQLLREKGFKSKYEEISEISRRLKQLAMEFNIPIIALSQFARKEGAMGGLRKPTLYDFKESGSIENDSNICMLLYRSDIRDNSKLGIIIAKNRLGPKGEVEFDFKESLSQIKETGVELAYN